MDLPAQSGTGALPLHCEDLTAETPQPRLLARDEPDGTAAEAPADARLIRHGACGKGWTGLTRGHCSGCHETFVSSAFDKHQRIHEGRLQCLTPYDVGLVARDKPWGVLWGMPGSYWDDQDAS